MAEVPPQDKKKKKKKKKQVKKSLASESEGTKKPANRFSRMETMWTTEESEGSGADDLVDEIVTLGPNASPEAVLSVSGLPLQTPRQVRVAAGRMAAIVHPANNVHNMDAQRALALVHRARDALIKRISDDRARKGQARKAPADDQTPTSDKESVTSTNRQASADRDGDRVPTMNSNESPMIISESPTGSDNDKTPGTPVETVSQTPVETVSQKATVNGGDTLGAATATLQDQRDLAVARVLSVSSTSWWDVLGLDSQATPDEVAKASRALSVLVHPDKHPHNAGDAHAAQAKINKAVVESRTTEEANSTPIAVWLDAGVSGNKGSGKGSGPGLWSMMYGDELFAAKFSNLSNNAGYFLAAVAAARLAYERCQRGRKLEMKTSCELLVKFMQQTVVIHEKPLAMMASRVTSAFRGLHTTWEHVPRSANPQDKVTAKLRSKYEELTVYRPKAKMSSYAMASHVRTERQRVPQDQTPSREVMQAGEPSNAQTPIRVTQEVLQPIEESPPNNAQRVLGYRNFDGANCAVNAVTAALGVWQGLLAKSKLRELYPTSQGEANAAMIKLHKTVGFVRGVQKDAAEVLYDLMTYDETLQALTVVNTSQRSCGCGMTDEGDIMTRLPTMCCVFPSQPQGAHGAVNLQELIDWHQNASRTQMCQRCKKETTESSTFLHPARLVLQIARFHQDGRKDGRAVTIPDAVMIDGQRFVVRAVVNHKGTKATSGHYTADVSRLGSWWRIDDDEEPAKSANRAQAPKEAYLVLLEHECAAEYVRMGAGVPLGRPGTGLLLGSGREQTKPTPPSSNKHGERSHTLNKPAEQGDKDQRTKVGSSQRSKTGDDPEPEPPPEPPPRRGRPPGSGRTDEYICPCCDRRYPACRGTARMMEHMNTCHRPFPENTVWEGSGLRQCEICGEALPNSNAGKGAHAKKCGMFRTRATKEHQRQSQRESNLDPPELFPQPRPRATQVEALEPAADGVREKLEAVAGEDWGYFAQRPRLRRSVAKEEFKEWREYVMSNCLAGYTAATFSTRLQKQRQFSNLARTAPILQLPSRPHPPARLDNPLANVVTREKRCRAFARLGAWAKAVSRINESDNGLYTPTPEVGVYAQSLFPTRSETIPKAPEGLTVQVKRSLLVKAVEKKMGRGRAPAVDGWTRELLLPLVRDDDCLAELTAMVEDLLAAKVDTIAARRWRASPLFVLKKDADATCLNGRPVGPESHMVKLACHVGLLVVGKEAIRQVIDEYQYGAIGSVEKAILYLRRRWRTSKYLYAFDATNAFNTASRSKMLSEMYSHEAFRPLWGLLSWVFAEDSILIMYEGNQAQQVIVASEGGKQGGVLVPLAFVVGFQPTLREIRSKCPYLTLVAFLDDLNATARASVPKEVQHIVENALRGFGLVVNWTKSKALARSDATEPFGNGSTATQGTIRCLGAAFSCGDADEAEWLHAYYTKKHRALLQNLPQLSSWWLKQHLLRHSIIHCVVFYARTHEPTTFARLASALDDKLSNVIFASLGKSCPISRALSVVPLRLGGLGLVRAGILSKVAFEACASGKRGEMARMLRVEDERTLKQVWGELNYDQQCMLMSAQSRDARQLFADGNIHISDTSFVTATKLRLMMEVLPTVSCSCGKPAQNDHVLRCTKIKGGAKILRHDMVTRILADQCKALGIAHTWEPRGRVQGTRIRPDLVVTIAGTLYAIDAVITAANKRRGVAQGNKYTGASADAAAAQKTKTWAFFTAGRFVPFAIETSGHLHREAVDFLSLLASPTPGHSFYELKGRIVAAVATGTHDLFQTVYWSSRATSVASCRKKKEETESFGLGRQEVDPHPNVISDPGRSSKAAPHPAARISDCSVTPD
jgi:hypothetical protein